MKLDKDEENQAKQTERATFELAEQRECFPAGELRQLAVTRDVSADKVWQDARSFLASIVESSDDAIITKDLNGIITSWNHGAECIFGYTAAEIIGKPVTILIPPERLNEEPGILGRIRAGLRVEHYETERRRKDGTLLYISLTVSPLKDENGKIIGASKIARDITERKRMQMELVRTKDELAQANADLEKKVLERTASLQKAIEQMEEFSYSVSHDLRGPLRAMNAYATALLTDYSAVLDPTAVNYIERIARNSQRMETLTHDVLAYSRVSRSEMSIGPVDLTKLLRELISHYIEFQPPAAHVMVEGCLPNVRGYEPVLGQCITNLLSNAVKFVPQGTVPRVHIRAEPVGGQVRLWIEDNGIGIKPEYQARLFMMFERLHRAEQFPGTGIGLAIVRRAMERMGGAVGVVSDGENGSRFWLQLPKA